MGEYGIGQPVPREEDPYLVRGLGRYVDDVTLTGQLRGYVLRSPHAHARIKSIDASAAKAMPGVHLVLTGRDEAITSLGMQKPLIPRKKADGSPAPATSQSALAREYVRYVGDFVAFVVAETLNQAKDAAEAIQVDYEVLPAVCAIEDAIAPGAPTLWQDYPQNTCFVHQAGDKAAVDAAFANAAHVTRHRMVINRITTNSMEPRGCIAEYDARDDRTTLRCTIQGPHIIRRTLAGEVLKVPENKVRIISENVGGGFGMKGGLYNEYVLCVAAARVLGRPVKWISDRSEGLLADEQCRDNITEAELALDKDGKFLGLRVKTLVNIGAYYTTDRCAGPATVNVGVLAGTYVLPTAHVDVTTVLTNTMMTGPYRGAGRPEAAYVIETIVDKAARELNLDPAELRRRNTIPASAMPYKTALVYTYDCGDFARNLEDALVKADYKGFPARLKESRRNGKLRGIGISNTVEASNVGLIEHAELRFDTSGAITVLVGSHDHGQGHQTAFRQIVADKLGVDPKRINFKWGDTDQIAIGTGTFGSRSAVAGGTAILTAVKKIVDKGTKIAAHLMEAGEHDIVFKDGKFTVAGTDKSIDISQLARDAFQPAKIPKGMEPGLIESGTFDGGHRTFPNGCHISEVEIDETTGEIELVRYTAVDDVGHMINPLLVEGQLHGGIAQGAGQALFENIVYDKSGQLLSGSFMDYAMPRADDFPPFDLGENEVPTKTNPLGVKGAGESGTVGALASVMNAINDAIWRVGGPYVQMPATPEKIWKAIAAARQSSAA
ncbi:MAG TPA: xanthine dehydrogenase family protein molybdopterin-binding subunit [Xanthobacteraceae bacterium]|nr:xanthine dehydrogenase family protein molybdopterin-binding subunit [Xanthobacteraceae bacterium]